MNKLSRTQNVKISNLIMMLIFLVPSGALAFFLVYYIPSTNQPLGQFVQIFSSPAYILLTYAKVVPFCQIRSAVHSFMFP